MNLLNQNTYPTRTLTQPEHLHNQNTYSTRTLTSAHYLTQTPEVLDKENRAVNPTTRHVELSTENLHIDREAIRKEHKKVRFRPYNEIKTYNVHLKLMTINVRGIKGKIKDLELTLLTHNTHIAGITETYLEPQENIHLPHLVCLAIILLLKFIEHLKLLM